MTVTQSTFDFLKIENQFTRGQYTDIQKALFYVGAMVAIVDRKQRELRKANREHREHDPMHNTYTWDAIGLNRLMRIVNRCMEETENRELLPLFHENFSEAAMSKLTYSEVCFWILSGRNQQFLLPC